MHHLLSRLLQKQGIKNPEQLSGQEKTTFENWNAILSVGEITVDKIAEFCDMQKHVIEAKWRSSINENTAQNNEKLAIQHTIYTTIADLIRKPSHEKEALEKYLQNLLLDKQE